MAVTITERCVGEPVGNMAFFPPGGFLKSLPRPVKASRVVRCMGHECACFVLIKSSAAPYRC